MLFYTGTKRRQYWEGKVIHGEKDGEIADARFQRAFYKLCYEG
jgi:hypothetical protein